jgi:hypothetical protein
MAKKKVKSVAELLEDAQDILAQIQDKVSENEVDDWSSDEDEDAWNDADLDEEDEEDQE